MKNLHFDKTFAFNVLALLLAVAGGFGFNEFEQMPEIAVIGAGIVAVVNLVSRLVLARQNL